MFLYLCLIATIAFCVVWDSIASRKIKQKNDNSTTQLIEMIATSMKYYEVIPRIRRAKAEILRYTGLSWFNAEAIMLRAEQDIIISRLWDEMRNYQREAQALYEQIERLAREYRECPAKVMRGSSVIDRADYAQRFLEVINRDKHYHQNDDTAV